MQDEDAKARLVGELLLDPPVAPAADLAVVEVRLRRVDRDDGDAVLPQHRVPVAEQLLEVDVADVPRVVVARDHDQRVAVDAVEVLPRQRVLVPEAEGRQVARADDDVRARSFTSLIARSSRFGSKYASPQCRSEMWAITVSRPPWPESMRPDGASEAVATLPMVTAETPVFQAYRGAEQPRFANRIELECAKVLDYYGIPWEYEPRTFVLDTDDEGRVTSAFTPDFYLPEQELYVEVTVMKQSLVTRKNRKLRELRRLYPTSRSSSSTGATSSAWPSDSSSSSPHRQASGRRAPARRHVPVARRDRAPRHRARARARSGLRGPRAAARRAAQVQRRLRRRPVARAPEPARTRLRRARGLRGRETGAVRLVKDLDTPIAGRHVLLVEDVVDTGLTLHFLRTLGAREPASLAAVTLLDRPYRRLVESIPLRYVGFTVPDELFAGYGLGLDERCSTCATSSPSGSPRRRSGRLAGRRRRRHRPPWVRRPPKTRDPPARAVEASACPRINGRAVRLQIAERVNGRAVDAHLEVDVRAGGVAGRAAVGDDLALADALPNADGDTRVVAYAVAIPPPWSTTTRLP